MTDKELCGILRGPDAKYFASKAANRIEELNQRHDISVGLIEAAEANLNQIRDCMIEDREHYEGLLGFAEDVERVAATFRARAADRSGE